MRALQVLRPKNLNGRFEVVERDIPEPNRV
jgi:hypothetical protein